MHGVSELVERLQRYEQLLESTEIGTWEWNVQTGEVRINERWANLIGYRLEELTPITTQTWPRFVHPDDRIQSDLEIEKHLRGETEFYECETRLRHRNGKWVWMLDKGKIVSRTKDGKPEWLMGSHLDITYRKQREELILQYNELLDKSNEVARIGTWELNLDTLYAKLSRITREILEWEEEGDIPLDKGIELYKEGASRTAVIKAINAAIESGSSFDRECQLISLKGKERWVRAIGIPEMEKGVCKRVYGLVQDITEKNRMHTELVLKEQQFRNTFENAPNGMALISPEGKWLMVNRSLCEILGYKEDELLKMSFGEITHPDDVERDIQYGTELFEGKRDSYQLEKRNIHKNGSIVWTILAVSLVRDKDGIPLHFVAQINDITREKQAHLEVASLLAVTREQNDRLLNFAHIVSHNLRSHVGNFSMLLDLIKLEVPESADNDFFPLLQQSTDGLQETISHLNEVVTFNSHQFEEMDDLDLNAFVKNTLNVLNAQILDAGVEVENTIPPGSMIKGLPAYLDSILINFLTNAIKYRATGRMPKISLSVKNSDPYLVLQIQDNGLGIDLNLHGAKLFGMYKTFHGNDDARGVGLFLTKNQIEAIKGKIEVESQVNVGTTFNVYFLNAGNS
ncbi:MAG: PAS domain-containing sensor histidine kinase [Bacteroidia bacterium]